MDEKQLVSGQISQLLGLPPRPTSRGGTITRPFLDDVAAAVGIDASGKNKVALTRAILAELGIDWDDRYASTETTSGGGGNVTLPALEAIRTGLQQHFRVTDRHEGPSERRSAEPVGHPDPAWLDSLEAESRRTEADGFDPASLEDARVRTIAAIVQRRGQSLFRRRLLRAYENRCAFTGCSALAALEAAHIVPYQGDQTNVVQNGILLRADIHTLFDLGLLGIDPDEVVITVAEQLAGTEYAALAGRRVTTPRAVRALPSHDALEWRRSHIGPFTD